jgi:hypothetical protein
VLAVIAHVRHRHPKYDAIMSSGKNKREARIVTRGEIEKVLRLWGQSKSAKKALCVEQAKDEDSDDADYVD